jgi:hypothetical protein
VSIDVLPERASTDPAVWARDLVSVRSMPRSIVLAMGARQLLVPRLGIPPASKNAFRVRRVEHNEALLGLDDAHLDFRVGVGVDAEHRLVRMVTTMRLKGWRADSTSRR